MANSGSSRAAGGAAATRLREKEKERQVEALKDKLRPLLKKLLKAKSHEKAFEAHTNFLEASKPIPGQERQAGFLKAAMDELGRELDFTQDSLRSRMMQIMMDDLGKTAMQDPENGPEKIDKVKELLCRGDVSEESKKKFQAWAEVAKAGETWHDRRCDLCNKKAQEGRKLLVCGGCQAVRYCSRECQKADWKAGGHKGMCEALKASNQEEGASGEEEEEGGSSSESQGRRVVPVSKALELAELVLKPPPVGKDPNAKSSAVSDTYERLFLQHWGGLVEEEKARNPLVAPLYSRSPPKAVDMLETYEALRAVRAAALEAWNSRVWPSVMPRAGVNGEAEYAELFGNQPGGGKEDADEGTRRVIEALVERLQAAVGESPIRPVLMLIKFCNNDDTMRAVFKAGAVPPLLNLSGPNQKPFLRCMALLCLQELCVHAGNQGPILATEGLLETLRQTLLDTRPEHALSRLRAAEALSCLMSRPPDMRHGSEGASEHQVAVRRLATRSGLMPDMLRALNELGNDEITMEMPVAPLGQMEEEQRAALVSGKVPNTFAKHGMGFMRVPYLPLMTFLAAIWRIIQLHQAAGVPAEMWDGCSREQLTGARAAIRAAVAAGKPQLKPMQQLIGPVMQLLERGIEDS